LELREENLIRLHTRGGLTWHAIETRKLVAAHLGERDLKYSTNVDNLVNVVKVSNMIAAPIFDNQGALRGMIHLVNKKLQSDIELVDIH
jgi:hypothetical protein